VNDQVAILPMAVAMVMGPQMITSVFLATSRDPGRNSGAYLAGVTLAVSAGLAISYWTAKLFQAAAEKTEASNSSDWLTWILVGLLVFLSIRTFLTRKTAKPPKWMESLQQAQPKMAFKLGFMLFILMPSDIIIMLSVGGFMATQKLAFVDGWPFVLATVFLAALPAFGYFLFRKRAISALPKIRAWMSDHAWLISMIVYVFFIYVFLG
jgi:hypothetical protein